MINYTSPLLNNSIYNLGSLGKGRASTRGHKGTLEASIDAASVRAFLEQFARWTAWERLVGSWADAILRLIADAAEEGGVPSFLTRYIKPDGSLDGRVWYDSLRRLEGAGFDSLWEQAPAGATPPWLLDGANPESVLIFLAKVRPPAAGLRDSCAWNRLDDNVLTHSAPGLCTAS